MKYVRYGNPHGEQLGVVDHRGVVRALATDLDISPDTIATQRLPRLSPSQIERLPVVPTDVRIGPCVASCGKIIAVGLNYAAHAEETHVSTYAEPTLFLKSTTAICGPTDVIQIPPGAQKVDWEVELAVIIGKKSRFISESEASASVFGYTVINDVSERTYQLEGSGQWTKGKSSDTFAPLGPWLVTADEVINPQDLHLWLDLNGERHQDSSTKLMLMGVNRLISYISKYMTLEPGDIISTGTPSGVGLGQNPPRFLRPGDTLRLGIDGIGVQTSHVENFS